MNSSPHFTDRDRYTSCFKINGTTTMNPFHWNDKQKYWISHITCRMSVKIKNKNINKHLIDMYPPSPWFDSHIRCVLHFHSLLLPLVVYSLSTFSLSCHFIWSLFLNCMGILRYSHINWWVNPYYIKIKCRTVFHRKSPPEQILID